MKTVADQSPDALNLLPLSAAQRTWLDPDPIAIDPERTSPDQTLPLLRNLLCLVSVVPRSSSGMVACTGEIS
jgi:hypothetical protein